MKILRSLLAVLVVVAAMGICTYAQKNEVAVTAVYVRENPDFKQANFKYNKSTDQIGGAFSITHYFGAKSGVGLNFEAADSATGSKSTDANLATFTAGLMFKARAHRIAPFVRVNAGVARLAARNTLLKFDKTNAGFALIAGGGLDVRLTKKVTLRLIDVDYVGTRILGSTVPHIRAGAGFVFRL